MLRVKEIALNDTFTLCEMGFTNSFGNTFYKDYENGFSLVIRPSTNDEAGKVNLFIEKSEVEEMDMSKVYDDVNKLIVKGIVIYE
jgi:hypothetical protein